MSGSNQRSRYEILLLRPEHKDWAKAVRIYSLIFNSPGWRSMYPKDLTKRTYKGFEAIDGLISHCIASGWTYGVFDTQYTPKNGVNSQLLWNFKDLEASEEMLLEQMDFPLVSIALSYDGYIPPPANTGSLSVVFPAMTEQNRRLDELDKRNPSDWKPKGLHQVLMRLGTSTKPNYAGKGLMKGLARHLVVQASAAGFHATQMRASSAAVLHVWQNLGDPYRSEVVCELNTGSIEVNDGTVVEPDMDIGNFRVARLWTTLR